MWMENNMLKQIINRQVKEYQQTNATDDGIVDAITEKTGIKASMVMQVLDPVKYAEQINQLQLAEQYEDAQAKQAAIQAAIEAKAIADAAAEQARVAAEVAAAQAQQQQQENIAKIKDIFQSWMKMPVVHTARSFYIYAKNEFGLDTDVIQSAVAGQAWFIVE